jgi:putative glutamine amidotransferase
MAGGDPYVLTPKNYQALLPGMRGFVIAGGTDIHPERYGMQPKEGYHYDLERDAMEAKLIQHAASKDKPLLGICRGAQMINVVHGGNLHFNIALAYEKADYPNGTLARIFFRKAMQVDSESLLYSILQCGNCSVNSLHTQAVDRLGEGLVITAEEPNGVVQAIEHPGKNYLLGIQFHPEYLQHRAQDRRIFQRLVAEAHA